MSSETTIVATHDRLQEWAAQIRDCQNLPEGMSIADWCSLHGITKPNYYYRLRQVRKACLAALPEKAVPQPVVPVKAELLKPVGPEAVPEVTITLNGCLIHVTEATPMALLSNVIGVIRNAQ